MTRRHAPLDRPQLGIALDADARDDDRPLESREGLQQDVLVLPAREDQYDGPARRVGERAQAMEVERHHLEPGVPGQLREHRPGAAADEHPVPAARELAADVGYYRRRARSAALVRELKDGERPVRHGTKLVILSGACTSSSPPTSQCRRRATAARNASCWRWCEGSRRSGTA